MNCSSTTSACRVRIGNDIHIRWKILREGEPEDFGGKTLRLLMKGTTATIEVTDFTLDGNIIDWMFYGKDQTVPSLYTFTLIENEGKENMFTVDKCDVLQLVACSCQSDDYDGPFDLFVDTDIVLPSSGLSAYEIAVLHGFKGTEEAWLASLSAPAEEAAKEAQSRVDALVTEASGTVADLVERTGAETSALISRTEEAVTATEQATAAAISATTAANDAAADARQVSEQVRTDENARVIAEQTRTDAEAIRVAAEQERVSAESERATAEQQRAAAEASRESAESARAAAEQQRSEDYDAYKADINERIATEATKASNAAQDASSSAASAAESMTAASQSASAAAASAAEAQESVSGVTEGLSGLQRDLGRYAEGEAVALSVGVSGKYVDASGKETTGTAYAISQAVALKAGNIYLFPSSSALGTGVAVFARKVTRTYDKAIDYEYTYDSEGRIATATADYDPGLVYTYTYDGETVTITDKDGETVEALPTTHIVTESFYDPVFRTNDTAMPERGCYVYPCTSDMDVVVSGLSADISAGSLLCVRYGVVASIVTNFLGTPAASVISQTFAALDARLTALEAGKAYLGNVTAGPLDANEITRYRYPLVLCGHGVPSADAVPVNLPEGIPWDGYPAFAGQIYINLDASSGGLYYAIGNEGVNNWKLA